MNIIMAFKMQFKKVKINELFFSISTRHIHFNVRHGVLKANMMRGKDGRTFEEQQMNGEK